MPKQRLESFSDGVFAIVITLLVLNVHLDRDQQLTLQTLASLGPEMLAFALTFVIVGVYWVSHHSMLHMIKAVDRRQLWLNLLLLLAVVFIPFPHTCLSDTCARLRALPEPAQQPAQFCLFQQHNFTDSTRHVLPATDWRICLCDD